MRKRMIWSALLVFYVGFVFSNSLTPAVESSAQSMSVLELVTNVMRTAGMENVGITEHFIRKAAHFSEYTVLGLLLFHCLLQYQFVRISRWRLHMQLGCLIPFVDETLQLFTEGRSCQITDVWLDCSGVLFGTLVYLGIGYWYNRWKQRNDKRDQREGNDKFEEKL